MQQCAVQKCAQQSRAEPSLTHRTDEWSPRDILRESRTQSRLVAPLSVRGVTRSSLSATPMLLVSRARTNTATRAASRLVHCVREHELSVE